MREQVVKQCSVDVNALEDLLLSVTYLQECIYLPNYCYITFILCNIGNRPVLKLWSLNWYCRKEKGN